ncbi:hypothetical protein [Homoserinimonas sp. A520]
MNKTNFAALALAAALTVGLAACTPAPKEVLDTATEVPTVDPLDLDGNGSVSEFEKQVGAKNAVRDYTLPDGTVVKVDPTQPFPEAVHAAVKAETVAPIAATRSGNARAQAEVALIGDLDLKAAELGRGIAVVYQTPSSGEGPIWVILASGQKQAPFFGSADKASVVAQAEAWTAARNYELIVH